MTNCPNRTLCVTCLRLPACDDWYPMRPGMTLEKWRKWKARKPMRNWQDTGHRYD